MDTISRQVYFESLKAGPAYQHGISRASYTGQRAYNVHRDLQRECVELQRTYDRRWRIAVAELDRRISVYENKLRLLRRERKDNALAKSLSALPPTTRVRLVTLGLHQHQQHYRQQHQQPMSSRHNGNDSSQLPRIKNPYLHDRDDECERTRYSDGWLDTSDLKIKMRGHSSSIS